MRILHTADWHLGKKLDFFNRLEEQKTVLEEIITIANDQKIDLVLVAGDLYDAFNPPNEAAELLYRTLKKLAREGKVPVVAIAGNHDSPDRINVPEVLARELGIILIGRPTDQVRIFQTEDGFSLQESVPGFVEIKLPQYDYPIRILHTAFANELRMKEYFGEDKQQSLQESLKNKWATLAQQFCDSDGVNLLTAHLYMAKKGIEKPEEPEGEKPLNIGTADMVYSDIVPREIQYAALGHLHRYQDVGLHQPVVYSGSPLAYSFSEAGQQKFVSIIDLEPRKEVQIDKIPLLSGKLLQRKTFNETKMAVDWLLAHQDCLVELTMATDEFLKADERNRIYQSHPGIIHLIPQAKNEKRASRQTSGIDLSKNIINLFREYFSAKNGGQEPNEQLMELFKEVLNS